MEQGPLAELLVERFENMPPQLRVAARFVLDHPKDVALMSMREQAHQAGVSHSTMMRLARWLGLEGYEDMRSLYAKAMREPGSLSGASARLVETQLAGDGGFSTVGVVADAVAAQIASLGEYGNATQFIAAANVLAGSRKLFCLGLRSEQAVAQHFVHTLSFLGCEVRLLDASGAMGIDALRGAGAGDAVLAISLAPYSRATIEVARQAAERRVAVVAITDSSVSPLARMARESMIVTTGSQSYFRSMAPALAATEILAALIATKSGANAEGKAREVEEELAALDVYWKPPR
ncbi:MurR/RpiR family transcriptional regulator [Mesorhizobium sp. M9A.F.Ca.ET.002.03.1.2]|nr:MurR/RpiR family transcriptional regulator [Mesorhizobium sp. M9A.F.Ca.ET.002.03.1.2]